MGISYQALTDFQKWFFFYLIKQGEAPVSLKGVTRNMCLGVKMTLNVDRFDEELERLRGEAEKLKDYGYLEIHPTHHQSYILSEVGELYLFQKILGPIIKAKEKNKAKEIIEYLQNDQENLGKINELLNAMNNEQPKESLKQMTDKIIRNAMPWLNAIDKIHQLSGKFGLF